MPVDKSYIGRKGEPVTMHVERGKIREFARAIKDDDPLYFDEAHAAREAGGIMPPVTFLQTASHWDDGRGRPACRLTSSGCSTASRSTSSSRRSTRATCSRPSARWWTCTRSRASAGAA